MIKNNAIEVINVSKSFIIPTEQKNTLKSYFINPFHRPEKRKFNALRNVTFNVQKGEFLGIIGRNGSGKSTLLKILAGIYQPDTGKVSVRGKVVPFLELGVGFNPELSERENVFLNGTILGMNRKYLEKKFDSIIEFAEVKEFIDMPLKNYSSGMQVRLAFAITTVTEGDIYLMDEVLAVGDSNFQSRCIETFNQYKSLGKTIILVTHDITTVERFCTRAILIRDGVVEIDNSAESTVACYINESSEDENQRIQKEQEKLEIQLEKEEEINVKNKLKKQRNDYRKVRILKIEFYNKDYVKKNVFRTGDDIIIKVVFKRIDKYINNLNFGIALINQEGHYIFGAGSFTEKIDTQRILKDERIILNLQKIPLRENIYSVNVHLWGSTKNESYHFIEKLGKFKIYNSDKFFGIVTLKHRWL